MSCGFFSMSSSKSFIILALLFRSSIHFELIFCVWCKVKIQLHSFACGYPVFPAPFVGNTILSPLNGLGAPVQKSFDHI